MSSNEASDDDEIFYPIVDIQEGVQSTSLDEEERHSSRGGSDTFGRENLDNCDKKMKQNIAHRKATRRKVEDAKEMSDEENDESLKKISAERDGEGDERAVKEHKVKKKSKKKSKRKELKKMERRKESVVTKKEAEVEENQFEFFSLKDVKKEVLSEEETAQNGDKTDESEDDVPLSMLEKTKENPEEITSKRTYAISNGGDVSDGEGRVKKLKIKLELTNSNEPEVLRRPNEYKCHDCGLVLPRRKKFSSHIYKVHQKAFYCITCLKAFKKKYQLEKHFSVHSLNRPYSCYHCGKMFKSGQSLKKHDRLFHSDSPDKKNFPCNVCSKILSSATCLEEHMRLHTGEKPVSCDLCGKLFTRDRDLKQHLHLHQESWKCDVCQKCFVTPFKLKEHYRSHTGEMPYECDKCDRKFARVADFRYHVGTHLGLKPYACEMCGMRFTTSSSVTRHRLNMHSSGPKAYQCERCNKRFHTQARLNAHAKNHENRKKFKCDLCPAMRSCMADLVKHQAVHSGEFRCDTCHRGCSSAERLAAHVARHDLAGKPYACFVCSLGYRSSQSLNKHLATVHKNEDIPKIAPQHLCTLCGQVFELKDKLNRHLKDEHIVLVIGEIYPIKEPETEQKDDEQEIAVIKTDYDGDLVPVEDEIQKEEAENVQEAVAVEEEVEKHVEPLKIPVVIPSIKEPTPAAAKIVQEIGVEIPIEKVENESKCVEEDQIKISETRVEEIKEVGDESKKAVVEDQIEDEAQQRKDDTVIKKTLEKQAADIKEFVITKKCDIDEPKTVVEKEESSPRKKDTVNNVKQFETNMSLIESLYAAKDIFESNRQREESIIKEPMPFDTSKFQEKNVPIVEKTNLNIPNTVDMSRRDFNLPSSLEMFRKDFNPIPLEDLIRKDLQNLTSTAASRKDFSSVPPIELTKKDYAAKEHRTSESVRHSDLVIPNVPQPLGIMDNMGVRDLSMDLKSQKMQPQKSTYDNLYSRLPYNDVSAAMAQHNRLLHSNSYRNIDEAIKPSFEGYSQMQGATDQVINPWFLAAKASDRSLAYKQSLPRNIVDTRQRYGDLRMPRLDTLQMQQTDYSTFNNLYRPSTNQRQDVSQLPSPLQRDSTDRKYCYEEETMDRKNYLDPFQHQKQIPDDRRKFLQMTTNPSNDLMTSSSRQNVRNYPSQVLPNRDYNVQSPLAVRDLSNSSSTDTQMSPHYPPHSFAAMANSQHFFQNFRDLQHRMFTSGIQNYAHPSRQHLISGMDMTSQRLVNTTSPLSPYHQSSPHLNLDNLSPISRHSYEDMPTQNTSVSNNNYPNNGQVPERNRQGIDNGDSNQGKDGNSGPYELRVAAT